MLATRLRSLVSSSALTLAVALAGCQTDNGMFGGTEEPEVGRAPLEERGFSDAEVAGVVQTLNQGEIELARLAMDRAQSQNVRDFAQLMIRDHQQANEVLSEVTRAANISTAPSRLREDLTARVDGIERDLRNLRGEDFDQEYLSSQIALHQEALRISESRLMPAAQNPELRSYLGELRPVLENHLEVARRVREGQPVAAR